jgi:hypothetical protein
MEAMRLVWAAAAGAVGGLWLARIAGWITGLDGAPLLVIAAVLGIGGGVVGLREAHRLTPLTHQERRDALIGWGIVGLLLAVVLLGAVTGFGE